MLTGPIWGEQLAGVENFIERIDAAAEQYMRKAWKDEFRHAGWGYSGYVCNAYHEVWHALAAYALYKLTGWARPYRAGPEVLDFETPFRWLEEGYVGGDTVWCRGFRRANKILRQGLLADSFKETIDAVG
jgi:hypothetical protein